MPSRWQREFSCNWCGSISTRLEGELRLPGWAGWKVAWRLCHNCVEHLFELRGQQTYGSATEFAKWSAAQQQYQ